LTTGDFIGLSTSKPVVVEIVIGKVATRFLQSAFRFRAAMKNAHAGSYVRFLLPDNGLPCPSQIYDVAHLQSRR
jgi:hypothetical protein